jgi:hypothetical protein
MNPMTQTMKTPKMSTTKLSTNPDIDFARLLDMSNQTLDTEMVPPIDQDQLDTASGMRDIGSLAAALSGAVRGAGSVGGKLPDNFGFDQIARDLGNSRSVDLQNRMALRKQQENDMLEAIKNTGIAAQAQAKAERRVKPLSDMDRRIANARLKQFDPNVPDLPDDMTYGNLEEEPFLAQILGIDNGTSGMSEYQKTMTDLRNTEVNAAIDARNRELAMKGVASSQKVDEASNDNAQVDPAVFDVIAKVLKSRGHTKIPESITNKDARTNPLYQAILRGAVPSANQADIQGRLKNPGGKPGSAKPLTEAQISTQRKQLRDTLAKEQIPNAVSIMGEIEAILRNNPKDIPGIGSTSALPDFAIGVGSSLGMTSPDASKLRTLLKSRLNALLQQRAGSAVTASEFDRVASELAAGNFTTDQQFIDAFNNSKRALRKMIQNTWAGFDQKAKDAYKTGFTDNDGFVTPGGEDYGRWAAQDQDYIPGGSKQQKTQTPPKTGTQVPGNENIPKDALDKSTGAYNNFMEGAIPYTPKPGATPEAKLDAKDQQSYDWAQKNPNDPKAQRIMKVLQNKIGTK